MARMMLRWVARLLIIAGAVLAVPVYAAMASASVQGTASSAPAAAAVSTGAPTAAAGSADGATVAAHSPAPGVQAVLTAAHSADARILQPQGVCQVPGIGDIGGLFGLCNAGSSGLIGDLNNVCQPSLPQPEPANGGIDALIRPPAGVAAGQTLYDSYGVAGQSWAAHGLQCSDMTSLIGNNVAGMVFDAAKSMDRVTITVYQSAAGNGILNWLQSTVDRLISALGNAIYFPYLAPVVILGAIWLAWHGLIRKRATRTIEGTLWMVIACAAAVWLIGRPADFTGMGTTVANGTTQVLNVAFAKLPSPGGGNCVPVQGGDPQVSANFGFTSSNGLVDSNANELWSVLVCKPWLDGELGTTQYATSPQAPQTVVNQYGRQLLWSQAIATNEQATTGLIQAKQSTYAGIAASLQKNNPAVYPLFQGNQWTTRLEIGFAALFAALVAGLLILLIALTLIILKLGFLLLLIAGPFFLIIGTHPGFGRIIAIRWFEMLVGVLMKQVAVAIALSVLLYAYSLIMGTTDAALPWALKILMIALVTVAVFIYRKPFQHLFSAVGYGVIGSQERADVSLRQASTTFRRVTLDSATAAVPGVAAYRVGRWARRNPGEAAALAAGVVGAAGAVSAGAAASKMAAAQGAGSAAGAADEAARVRAGADGQVPADGDAAAHPDQAGGRPSTAERTRRWPGGDAEGGRRSAPPLHLPPRTAGGDDGPGQSSGWARSAAQTGAAPRSGEAPPRPSTARGTAAPATAAPGTATPSTTPPGPRPGPAPSRSGGPAVSSRWPGGRSAGGRPARPPAASPGPAPRSSPPPVSPPAFGGGPSGGGPTRGGNGRGGNGGRPGRAPSAGTTAGSAARPRWQPGPIRPSSGWTGRTRSSSASGTAPSAGPRSPAPGGNGGTAAPGTPAPAAPAPGSSDGGPMPFWLRPVRRRK
ncbi:MAG TPA: type IV secretion system protein [Streptosporangiaceae bacterium]